jgi:hypothetical protein
MCKDQGLGNPVCNVHCQSPLELTLCFWFYTLFAICRCDTCELIWTVPCNWQQCVDYCSVFTALEVPDSKSWTEMFKKWSWNACHELYNGILHWSQDIKYSKGFYNSIILHFSVPFYPSPLSPFLLSLLFFPLLPFPFSLLLIFVPPKLNYSVWKCK